MVRTRVGYAGGEEENPTYYNLGGHSETIQIDYDPSKISYEQLLDIFWDSHTPDMPSYSLQYRNVVFYHNEEQKKLAIKSKNRYAEKVKADIYTEILPFTGFYLAEDYHQKYYLQQETDIYSELRQVYPDTEDFVNSTAAARLNGYAGVYGTEEQLKKELDNLGLSEAAEERLLEIAGRGLRPGCSVN